MARPDFSKRSFAAEWLDANGQSRELPDYLRDLAWFNRDALGPWAISAGSPRKTFTLLDAGCGDGDLLRTVARWAAGKGLAFSLTGIDLDPHTIAIARARTDDAANIQFQAADIFAAAPAQPVDFIVSSLLAHHLDDAQIIELIRMMERAARRGWLIYDLQRSAVAYHAIGAIGKIARLHPMVVRDGQISVTRSLTKSEWRDRVRAARLDPTQVGIDWFFYRLLVSRLR
jgi:SAM-dependent methyltransferase